MATSDHSPELLARVSGTTVVFAPSRVNFYLPHGGKNKLDMVFPGSQLSAPTGTALLPSQTNYLLGNDPSHWITHIPNYRQVSYPALYPGIDLVFYGNGRQMEHDFVVAPGADYRQIRMHFNGITARLDQLGGLAIPLANRILQLERPVIYQQQDGKRVPRIGSFRMMPNGDIAFAIGDYDRRQPLVIDPVLDFATYLSQDAEDDGDTIPIAVDSTGNNYLTGTASYGYPVTQNAFNGCPACSTEQVVTFISKLSADGTNLIYSTVLGGNDFAQPTGIAVDSNGNAIVSGWTGASNFPTKNGQPILPETNAYLGFLVSLTPDGSALNFGTMLGPSPTATFQSMTYTSGVAVDSAGNAYVTGETGNGFAVSPGALNQGGSGTTNGQFNVYLAKFNPTGALLYSAVLGVADPQNGGGGPIGASALAVDAAGNAYVAGQAGTLWPISTNAYLQQIAGPMPYATPFVTKVAPDAKSILYSTYLDYAYTVAGISVLSNGNVVVAGSLVGPNHPTTPNAYQAGSAGGGEGFVTELNATGSALIYATTIGDSSYYLNGMALDADQNVWLAAETLNPQFPLVTPVQGTFPLPGGITQRVSLLNQLDSAGQALKMSTFLGGNAAGYASSLAVDTAGKVHVSGAAEYDMYTTPGAYLGSVPTPGVGFTEEDYTYVALIDPATAGGALCLATGPVNYGLSFGYVIPQSTATQSVSVINCGNAPLTFTSVATDNAVFTMPAANNSCTGFLAVNNSCTVNVAFTPTAVQSYSGQLTFTSNASVATTQIPIFGSGGAPSAAFGPAGLSQALIFPDLLVGQTSQPELIELYNNGTVPLVVNLAQIAVTSGFALTAGGGNCTSSLAPQQSCSISVEFTPTVAGTITGTLSVSSNDPVNPVITASLTGTAFAAYPVPAITALLNPSYPINSGTSPITISVEGTHFFAASVVYINGVAQTTSYSSDTLLAVTFNASLLNAVGEIPVTVVNPAPGGGVSAPYPLIAYLGIPMTASALTIDPVGGLLYAAIPSTSSQNPNTVIPINPATGALMTPIAVATNPQRLAISSDGSELYVASTGVLQRINLKTLAIEKTFNLPVDPEYGQTYVQEMHVVPASPQSIVVELFANVDPEEDGAALYNDSGLVNWLPSDTNVNGQNTIFWLDSFTFASSPSVLYGLPQSGSFFTEAQVSPAGLSLSGPNSPGEISQTTGSLVRSDGSYLYTNSGQVWDPASQKLLGTYLGSNGSQLFFTSSVVPVPGDGRTYFLDEGNQYADYQSLSIDVYDQASYALLGTIPFTDIYPPDGVDLLRWGSNGFAFRSVDTTGSQPAANEIVIVTSSLVANSNGAPIPILSSVSPSPVVGGGPAYTMQLTGTGFTSATTVSVNGVTRTTTFINSTSLTCQVLAADIATAGQLDVQVTTPAPGGGTSSVVTVPVLPGRPTPAVSISPSQVTINTSQTLGIVVTVNGGFGAPAPTGTVTLSSGSYTSAPAPVSGGMASVAIPAGTLPVGKNALTATYSGDGYYAQATSIALVTVTLSPGFTLSASPATVSVTQGGQANTTIMITDTSGFSGNVNLSATGLPAGITASFSAGATAGTQTLTLAASATAATTNSPVTIGIAGASGSASANTTVALTITAEPAFTSGSGSATSITLSPGATSGNTATINVVGTNGFSGTVNLACSVSTSMADVSDKPTCAISPSSVSISGGAAKSATLTVTTTAASTAYWPSAGGAALALALFFVRPRRRRFWHAGSALCILFASMGFIACGGGSGGGSGGQGGSPGTTPGTYTITVTGAAASVSATVTSVTLTVQ